MTRVKPVVLCILDGWGINPRREGNAVALANTPNFDRLMATCPNSTLITFGPDVGLPSGQMGNSEVGHTNIGAGRVVALGLGKIDLAVEDGSFARNPEVLDFIAALKASGGTAHLMGVVSDGGVHGHIRHLLAAVHTIAGAGVPVAIHAITDGRDVAPSSAAEFMAQLLADLPPRARVVTVNGRFWAMDRDMRWERVEKAYDAMIRGKGKTAADAGAAITQAYDTGETDEFITPTVIGDYAGAKDGDGFFCLNFRADRAREILSAIGAPSFSAFDRRKIAWASMLGMAEYSDAHNAFMHTVYPKQDIHNTLAHWVAAHELTQFHIAETEKYPHVTFFLNGGKEEPETGEDRFMPPSPKVATYDQAPEMSSVAVTDHLVAAIGKGYDLIVANYANPDMVGHTGVVEAGIKAVEAVDRALGRVLAALDKAGGAMLVIADHGNCETMIDPVTGGPDTAHTKNPVPAILVGWPESVKLRAGRLADVAPTLLEMMDLAPPPEMTGHSLIDRG